VEFSITVLDGCAVARLIHLVRHGASSPAGDNRFFGRTDLPLTAAGEAQAQALGKLLAPLRPESIWVSPAVRAVRTAALALPQAAARFATVPELQEVDFGRWEGKSFAQIALESPELVRRWNDDEADFGFPGGEPMAVYRERMRLLGQRLAEAPGDELVAFTHGGVIRSLICQVLGLAPRHYLLFAIPTGSLTTLELHAQLGVLRAIIPARPEDAPWRG